MTKYWTIDPAVAAGTDKNDNADAIHLKAIAEAGALLAAGEIVAFPTETVYGLGADATNSAAVEAVFRAKGRPSDNPLIVHIADWAQLDGLVADVSDAARRLMARFWPGPLTLVLPARPGAVSPRVTAGLATVAVRMPAHPVALALIRAAGCPVAAPSANRSGRPSPTLAAHVREDLAGRIAGLVDGGPTGVGLESTVAEVIGDRVHILRPGGVTAGDLQAAVPDCTVEDARQDHLVHQTTPTSGGNEDNESYIPRSPGMKYTHYAPQGELTIIRARAVEAAHSPQDEDLVRAWIQQQVNKARKRGALTGILTTPERAGRYEADLVIPCGSASDLEAAAHNLYAALRQFDEQAIAFIWAEAYPEEGMGVALMNRLLKAAGGRIVEV